jgi:NADPH:quinone reductase-like Zn-dependent oxidoreductase/NAD(P)-dependent dehydrogenase (short-subunit alcohol dehydrogenase family)
VGHSSGEIAAAYAVNGISLESACRLSYFRGQLAETLVESSSPGTMLAVALSALDATPYFNRVRDASIACINSPYNVTIGGPRAQILILKELLDADGLFCRELKTGVAYHTTQMSDIANSYRQKINKLERGSKPGPSATMASSVTGEWVSDLDELCNPDYWVQNMVQTVRFDEAVSKILQQSSEPRNHPKISEIVEIGAHAALQRPMTEILGSLHHGARYSSFLSRFDPSLMTTLNLLGKLHCSGVPLRLDKVNDLDITREANYKCLSNLPAYTFDHTRLTPKYGLSASIRQRPHFPLPLLGAPEPEWSPLEPRWRRNLNIHQFPWLTDHRINDVVLFPAAGMVAIAIEAAYTMRSKDNVILGICVKKAIFLNPIVINTADDGGTDIKTSLRSTSDASQRDSSNSEVNIYVRQNETWIQTFQCTVQVEYEQSSLSQELSSGARVRQSQWQSKYTNTVNTCDQRVKTSTIYPHLSRMGMQYGPSFQGLEEVYCNSGRSATGKLSARKVQDLSSGASEHYFIHPAVLDSLLHLAWIIHSDGATKSIVTSVPARLNSIWFSREWLRGDNMAGEELRTCNTAVAHGFGGLDTSAIVVNEAGEVVMAMNSLQTTMSSRDHMDSEPKVARRLCYSLETKPDVEFLDPDQAKGILEGSQTPLADYLELILFKNPEAKILDFTADSETLDEFLRSARRSFGTFAKYEFANVSNEFLETIRERYADECAADTIRFTTLDFKTSLEEQGLETASYDIVIFSTTHLSPTKKKRSTESFEQLLRCGGRLIEIVSKSTANGTDGCYTSELTKKWVSEALSEPRILSMIAVAQPYNIDGQEKNGFAISTMTLIGPNRFSTTSLAKYIIVIEDSLEQKELAHSLQSTLATRLGLASTIMLLSELKTAGPLPTQRIVFLAEMSRALLRNMSKAEFTELKLLTDIGQQIHWVTKSQQDRSNSPSLNMIHGLARVLRSEDPRRAFTTISLEHLSTAAEDVDMLAKLLRSDLVPSTNAPCETEYFVKKGIVHVQRIVENDDVDDFVFSRTIAQELQVSLEKLGPVELEIKSPGVLDSLRCVPAPPLNPVLGDEEVEVQVQVFGLNFKDVVIALGRLPQNTLGCECAGIITRVGSNARLKPGSRVMMAQNGCMKTVNRCHQDLVVEIPEFLSFEGAAAIPIAGVTAYYSLVEQARLQANETVLVHSGAGATGQMCIQIALLLGAKVYTTVSSHEKKDFLVWSYGLKPEQIYYSRDTSFASSIMAATQNKGVDVVVNSLAGDKLQASWEVVAPFGRFIELGRTEIINNSKLAMAHFDKNISFMAVAVDDMVALRPALLQKNLSAVAGMIIEGKLKLPFPLQTYALSAAKEAFQHLMSGKSTGKLVVKVEPTDVVKACITQDSGRELNPDATYLIAGGFGGIGRSAARWMVSKGARNLILLSRSGPVSESARLLVGELENAGVRVAARACDIADEGALAAVLADCASYMPPVRGCLQGTMVLRVSAFAKRDIKARIYTNRIFKDALFENMTYEDWNTCMQSKVQASENLDKLLPSGMDFYILLSSLSGIVGLKGQANYAAGNTFQDALARSRMERGEKVVSLDLGVMNKVGIVAENQDIGRLAKAHMLSVEEEELHALLDYYCLTPAPPVESRTGGAQLLVGLPTSHFLESNGADIPSAYSQPLFSRLRVVDRNDETGSSSGKTASQSVTDYSRQFKAANSSAEAAAVVVDGLVKKLSQTLSMSAEELDPTKSLQQYSVDSLIAVEIRNWFAKEFASNVAIFTFLGAPSILAVGTLVTDASTLRQTGNGT